MNIIGSKKALAKFRTDEIRKARDEVKADDSHLNDSPERKEISRRGNKTLRYLVHKNAPYFLVISVQHFLPLPQGEDTDACNKKQLASVGEGKTLSQSFVIFHYFLSVYLCWASMPNLLLAFSIGGRSSCLVLLVKTITNADGVLLKWKMDN